MRLKSLLAAFPNLSNCKRTLSSKGYISAATAALLAVLVLLSCFFAASDERKVKKVAYDYFSCVQSRAYEEGLDLVYFHKSPEKWRDLTLELYPQNPLETFKIKGVTRLTNQLYEVHTWLVTEYDPDPGPDDTCVNYVGLIDGEWKFIVNRSHVPEDMYRFPYDPDRMEIIL